MTQTANEPSTVLLRRVPDRRPDLWPEAVAALLDHGDALAFCGKNDRVAIKVHVGEPGLTEPLPPEVAGVVARRLRARAAQPFFTDSSVLYSGRRSNGPGHTEVAIERGFTLERAGAVFLPADGMVGNLEVEVSIEGRHYAKVGVAEAIANANGVVIVSHATGHIGAGLGATLKNLGMGCSARKGKLLQHSDTRPFVREGECAACGVCLEHCPSGALAWKGSVAHIEESLCTGCGECLAFCVNDAIAFRWDSAPAMLQEKMVEHALGAVRALKGKIVCLLGIVNLTQHCDCWAPGSPRVAADVGFALSTDPVALDQAALDLVAAASGQPLDRLAWPKLDGTVQLAYAEELGLGSRNVRVIEI
jgi:uncharacterized Fe-S center protein